MVRLICISLVAFHFGLAKVYSQESGFEFGRVSYAELDMKVYEKDTAAAAVVLNEFGEAFFDLEDLNRIIFKYHVKIKILRESGKSHADFVIPARKTDLSRQEVIRNIRASSFNRDGNSWKESTLDPKKIFNENVNSDYSLTKFAIPDVRVGSVIEIQYELQSPYTFKFVPWEFQSDIPKVISEFWAKYPAYYRYNITLKGYLKLTKSENSPIKNCIITGSDGKGGNAGADCTFYKLAMENIPAFKEEEYLTATKNFLSAVNFELSQVTQLDGRVTKYTTEWKDAEAQLKTHTYFGDQIKKARNLYETKANEIKLNEKEPKAISRTIHDYFKNNFIWNGEFGSFTDQGVKKCQDLKKGNVADINLSMLAALQEAGVNAEPVLISTRSNGMPIKLHPVLTDFNYVLVRVKINNEFHFLDATNPLYPFGFLPERCLNGQGRALGETSDWIDLKPSAKERTIIDLKLSLSLDGGMAGTATISHSGYAAHNSRQSYFTANDEEEYTKKRTAMWPNLEVKNFQIENQKDIEKSFVEKFEINFDNQNSGSGIVYFQPFIFKLLDKNPFTSTERLYPVDFGAPKQIIYLLSLDYPEGYTPEDLPEDIALTLPASGGAFLFGVNKLPGKLLVSSNLNLNKPLYTSAEYHYLRELFAQYVSVQQAQLVLKKN